MKFYRVEKTSDNIKEEFSPKIPKRILSGNIEDSITPRVCVSSTINGCLGSVPWGGCNIESFLEENNYIVRVYEFESNDINKSNIVTPDFLYEKDLVRDAVIHDEHWILNQNIRPCKIYNIKIESIQVLWRETFSFQDSIKIREDISYIEDADVFMSYEIVGKYSLVS